MKLTLLFFQEWHPCQTCSMYFSSQTDLILHNNVSHCDREVRKCQFCDEKFPSDFEYHKHVNDKHKVNRINEPKNPNVSLCYLTIQVESFDNEIIGFLSQDMATCENWKPCERCLCLFPSSKELSRHRVQHHFHEIVKTRAYPAKPKPQTRHALWKVQKYKVFVLLMPEHKDLQMCLIQICNFFVKKRIKLIKNNQLKYLGSSSFRLQPLLN